MFKKSRKNTEVMCQLDFLPDGFRHTHLNPNKILYDPTLAVSQEGQAFIAEIEPFSESGGPLLNHAHDQCLTRRLRPGQKVALILAYRRSLMELSSRLEKYCLIPGDQVTLLGGDGYAGSFLSCLEKYGVPITARVIGAILDPISQQALLTTSFPRTFYPALSSLKTKPITIGIVGVRMDSGKSTVARNLAIQFEQAGLAVSAGKLTGFGCLYETRSLCKNFTVDFTDFGVPSTCGPNESLALSATNRIMEQLYESNSDVLLLEFGGDLIGPYRVASVLKILRKELDIVILTAFDLCGIAGALNMLEEIRVPLHFVSGPISNQKLGHDLIREYFGLQAESNLYPMKETFQRCMDIRLKSRPWRPDRDYSATSIG